MRLAARKDSNQQLIVDGLRKGGASVYVLDRPLDLLVGYKGWTVLIEVKAQKGPRGGVSSKGLTVPQKEFIETWKGGRILIVRTLKDAMMGLGMGGR